MRGTRVKPGSLRGGVGGLFLAQFEIGGDALKKRKAKNVEMQQKISWKGCEKLDE